MKYPFEPFKVDTVLGEKTGKVLHSGVDVNGLKGGNTDCGTLLDAIYEGVCVEVGTTPSLGIYLSYKITGPWGERYVTYLHCQKLHVKLGERFAEGIVLAEMGSTGNSTSCHLHWEVCRRKDTKGYAKDLKDLENYEDPITFVEKWKNQKGTEEVITTKTLILQALNEKGEPMQLGTLLSKWRDSERDAALNAKRLKDLMEEHNTVVEQLADVEAACMALKELTRTQDKRVKALEIELTAANSQIAKLNAAPSPKLVQKPTGAIKEHSVVNDSLAKLFNQLGVWLRRKLG